MSNNRPVDLGINAFLGLPITAVTSITHRITGVVLFAAVPILLIMLSCSLESQESFDHLKGLMDNFLVKIVLWGIVSSLLFHVIAGFRHLLMDMGIGETLEGGKRGSVLVLVLSAIAVVLSGAWIICL